MKDRPKKLKYPEKCKCSVTSSIANTNFRFPNLSEIWESLKSFSEIFRNFLEKMSKMYLSLSGYKLES
jgi:hypothetical protein